MKKYIFITFSIINAGGSQLYVRNKADYLRKNGWQVYVFSAMEGPILIEGLKQYQNFINHLIGNPPQIFPSFKRERIVKSVINVVGIDDSECIVETHSTVFGLWGELIAERLRGIHFLYSLEETNRVLNQRHFDFTVFKWKQHAFAGIVNKSLIQFFSSYNFKILEEHSYWLPAYCNNPVEDIPCGIFLPEADFNICLMGRLNKDFIKPTAYRIMDYVKNNPERKYNVIVIGGGEQHQLKDITNFFSILPNCNIVMTGFLMPISFSFIRNMDVVVSSAGCCGTCYDQGVPVISIDAHDLLPIGIYKETTPNSLFRNNEPYVELCNLLDDILLNKTFSKRDVSFTTAEYDFSEHLRFLENIPKPQEYFDILSIRLPFKTILKTRFKLLVYKLIGVKAYTRLSKYRKMF